MAPISHAKVAQCFQPVNSAIGRVAIGCGSPLDGWHQIRARAGWVAPNSHWMGGTKFPGWHQIPAPNPNSRTAATSLLRPAWWVSPLSGGCDQPAATSLVGVTSFSYHQLGGCHLFQLPNTPSRLFCHDTPDSLVLQPRFHRRGSVGWVAPISRAGWVAPISHAKVAQGFQPVNSAVGWVARISGSRQFPAHVLGSILSRHRLEDTGPKRLSHGVRLSRDADKTPVCSKMPAR